MRNLYLMLTFLIGTVSFAQIDFLMPPNSTATGNHSGLDYTYSQRCC